MIGIIVILLILLMMIFKIVNQKTTDLEKEDSSEEVSDVEEEKLEKVNVVGYHLVTYAQSANSNSFLKSLTITASDDAKIHFVIGSIDEKSVLQERTSFDMDCSKGENTFDILKERHLLKQGEYLLMDINGQDVLYTQKGKNAKSLVQNENNKVSGKMILSESDYILPFKYTLEKVKTYNGLVIGNDITTKEGGKGLNATDENLDYYNITKTRLENTFETVNINRMNATEWEKTENKKEWIQNNLKKELMTDLDLVIFQLGDNDNQEDNLENDITELVEQVRKYSPNVEIVWIGLWNINEKILNRLPTICERLDVEFLNISDLSVAEYQSLVTETVENFETMVPEVKEIRYPNNEAMQIISNRMMEILGFDF